MKTLYLAHCTEFEAGCGSRPDGIVISASFDDLKKHIKEDEDCGSYEIFWRYDKPYEVFCDDATYEMILKKMNCNERNIYWITNEDIKNWGFFKKI